MNVGASKGDLPFRAQYLITRRAEYVWGTLSEFSRQWRCLSADAMEQLDAWLILRLGHVFPKSPL
jgi:hypothetical protein